MAVEAELATVTYLILLACTVLAWPRFLKPAGPWRWFFAGGFGFIAWAGWPGGGGWGGLVPALGALVFGVVAINGIGGLLGLLRKAEG